MLKIRATINKSDTVILALTQENWFRLVNNQPIMFPGSDVGLDVAHVVIIGGETEADIKEDLRSIGVFV